MQTATRCKQGGARGATVAALGLTLRERAAVREAHIFDTAPGSAPGLRVIACSCGWGTEIRDHLPTASEMFGEHLSGWMLHTADEKRRRARIELEMDRALEDGHALTRERFATHEDVAEADADVVSIARPVELWRIQRPGAVAHLIKWHGKIAACGVEVSGPTSQDARAYTRKCSHCTGRA